MTGITIARDPGDSIAAAAPVGWAISRLTAAFERSGVTVRTVERLDPAHIASATLVAGAGTATAANRLARSGIPGPSGPESLVLLPSSGDTGQGVLACGADVRGLVYAVLELADRVGQARDPIGALLEAPSWSGRPTRYAA